MDENRFDSLADATLQALLRELDGLDDVEAELSQGVLTVSFEAGAPYIVNSHRAARQIWFAADRAAWHFEPDAEGARWTNTRPPHEELWDVVTASLTRRLGRPVALKRGV
ncbi:MAG TPA: iron donor protein CyaY [Polyangiaceae bacterium]|nr:iron donor protein CyaY [Polyangiaceae bacterium]